MRYNLNMGEHITFFLAFFAGVLSFLSPCVLPVFPAFLGYLTGTSLSSSSLEESNGVIRRRLIWNAVLFALGFVLFFAFLGISTGLVGQFFFSRQIFFQYLGGGVIIILGLHLLGVFKLVFLQYERRLVFPQWFERLGVWKSFFVGILFSVGWSPCYGPITGAILTLIATQGSVGLGLWFFVWYAAGFMFPFLLFSIFAGVALQWIRGSSRWLAYMNKVAGFFVVLLGVLLLTGYFNVLVNDLSAQYTQWDIWQFN